MAYYPLFVDLSNKNILIVGGGHVALLKAERLLPFGPNITIASPTLDEGFDQLPLLNYLQTPWTPSLVEGMDIVFAATDNAELNGQIAQYCREMDIIVNSVDNKAESTFISPAIVAEGELVIGISTSGASPAVAHLLKKVVREALPVHIVDILDFLQRVRPQVKAAIPDGKKREEAFLELAKKCFEKDSAVSLAEYQEILEKYEQA